MLPGSICIITSSCITAYYRGSQLYSNCQLTLFLIQIIFTSFLISCQIKLWVCVRNLGRRLQRKGRRWGRWRQRREARHGTSSRPSRWRRWGRRRRGPRRSRPSGCGPNRWGRAPGRSGPSSRGRTLPGPGPWSPPSPGPTIRKRGFKRIENRSKYGTTNKLKMKGKGRETSGRFFWLREASAALRRPRTCSWCDFGRVRCPWE